MPSMPDIKLTRTDTTHDLSQKAEKLGTCLVHNNEKNSSHHKNLYLSDWVESWVAPGPTYERSRGKVEKR